MNDFGERLIKVVVGGLVAYVVSSLLITAFITGTASSDTLIKTVLPVIIAAAVVIGVVATSFKTGT